LNEPLKKQVIIGNRPIITSANTPIAVVHHYRS